jgi:hypothetical protein
MNVIGLTKIRNEAAIIRDTLTSWGEICTGGIYVYDEASTDSTADICRKHPAVKVLIENKEWEPDQFRAEGANRQKLLTRAQQDAGPDDWFVYFDADEFLFLKDRLLFYEAGVRSIACALYDVHITPEDVTAPYLSRNWVDPRYRQIVFFFKNSPRITYGHSGQREIIADSGSRIAHAGIIKHYGKGLSVEAWEKKCDFYANHVPQYAEKWRARKGKAIKADYLSDIGDKLIRFSGVLTGENPGYLSAESTLGSKDFMP